MFLVIWPTTDKQTSVTGRLADRIEYQVYIPTGWPTDRLTKQQTSVTGRLADRIEYQVYNPTSWPTDRLIKQHSNS